MFKEGADLSYCSLIKCLIFIREALSQATLPVLRSKRKTRPIQSLTPLRGYEKLVSF